MDIEKIIGMNIMKKVGVDLEKGSIKVIQEGMIEVVTVDQGQDQEQVLTETE